MNTIVQLGRLAARQAVKSAQEQPTVHPRAELILDNNYGAESDRDDPVRLNRMSKDAPYMPGRKNPSELMFGRFGRARYENEPVPGGGGSMWGDEVVGRRGAHPNSEWANEIVNWNVPYYSPLGHVEYDNYRARETGKPDTRAAQAIQSKLLLAQDPRGKGGWAYVNKEQDK